MQNLARVVEMVHVTQQSLRLVEELLDTPTTAPLCAEVAPRAGEGVGAVEAPRGILYHRYEYDDQGRVAAADCVIPTTQNNANIHYDLRALVQQLATPEMTDERLELLCSMLVRAYDPCISCSVH
jgi:coenzyme F420-reducing hydrogenase alpha subunit